MPNTHGIAPVIIHNFGLVYQKGKGQIMHSGMAYNVQKSPRPVTEWKYSQDVQVRDDVDVTRLEATVASLM